VPDVSDARERPGPGADARLPLSHWILGLGPGGLLVAWIPVCFGFLPWVDVAVLASLASLLGSGVVVGASIALLPSRVEHRAMAVANFLVFSGFIASIGRAEFEAGVRPLDFNACTASIRAPYAPPAAGS
jgi:hypothetical protein